jgi:hypothetical protein
MKAKFFTVVCALSLLLAQNAGAGCSHCNPDTAEDELFVDRKIYLNVDQIAFHDSKIFVQINDDVFPVSAVFSDLQGYYINARGVRCKSWEWKCPKSGCGRCNPLEYYTCLSCGTEMLD